MPRSAGYKYFERAATRFRKDFYTKVLFSRGWVRDTWDPQQLYIKSDWEGPSLDDIPPDIQARVRFFLLQLGKKFTLRYGSSNLLPRQQALLEFFKSSPDFLVIPSDKNLGPVLLERSTYIKRALSDHLTTDTYLELTATAARTEINATCAAIYSWIGEAKAQKCISEDDEKYLYRHLEKTADSPYSVFYITAKIHKTPWKTRPIVSTSGSTTEGLSKWLHQKLHPLCQHLSSYISSSFDLVQALKSFRAPPLLPDQRLRLFTMDATAMYTNIDTEHALATLPTILHRHFRSTEVKHICEALKLVMNNNIFTFGDLFFRQLNGTAMGTPTAPTYATLYYGVFEEMQLFPEFFRSLLFFKRYLDDGIGIWLCHADANIDAQIWQAFKNRCDSFGNLRWTVTDLATSVNFMDLTVSLDPSTGNITTTVYEKPENLYAYLPPHSCHPPGITKGLIFGEINRIFRLTSNYSDRLAAVQRLYHRILRRGHSSATIKPYFQCALQRQANPTVLDPYDPAGWEDTPVFFHVRYHPLNPSRRDIQRLFRSTMIQPPNEPKLGTLRNNLDYRIYIDRLIIAFSRGLNLKNILFPRTLRDLDNKPPSSFLQRE